MARDTVLVVAPHPDDETLGCGGTLLKHLAAGDSVHWLIATRMDATVGFSEAEIDARHRLIQRVASAYPFQQTHTLDFPTTMLDAIPRRDVVGAMKPVFQEVAPTVVYLPWHGDAHTDHRVVFEAGTSLVKAFRQPSVERVLCYEVLSETESAIGDRGRAFVPNVFEDISPWVERKLELLQMFSGELGAFPFPRSVEAVRALAAFRGTAAGFEAAESFELLRERRP